MSVMKALLILLVSLESGYGLKCFESPVCTSSNGQKMQNCIQPKERTCADKEVCLTQTITMLVAGKPGQPGMTQTMTRRNCSVACTESMKNQSCSNLPMPGAKCDIKCCSTELCNTNTSPIPPTTPSSNNTKAPSVSGADLSCYLCDTGTPGQDNVTSRVSCDKPVQQRCAAPGDPVGKLIDRCMTVTAKMKDPKTGEITDIEMRNCSTSMMNQCTNMCKNLNSTGTLAYCDSKCCVGNLCNGKEQPTDTPAPPKAGQTLSAMVNMIAIVVGIFVAVYIQ